MTGPLVWVLLGKTTQEAWDAAEAARTQAAHKHFAAKDALDAANYRFNAIDDAARFEAWSKSYLRKIYDAERAEEAKTAGAAAVGDAG